MRILGFRRIYRILGPVATRTRAHIWVYRWEVLDTCLECVRHVTDILVYQVKA